MPLIRSISGLRGTLGDSLTPDTIEKYTSGFSKYCASGPVILGMDGRPSGKWIEDIVVRTLSKCGRDVVIAGMVPTPTVQLLTEHSDAAGGIAITASHNPEEWNGLKFLSSNGVFLDSFENQELWNIVDSSKFFKSSVTGEVKSFENPIESHIDNIFAVDFLKPHIENVKNLKLKIVVDAVNASGSYAIPQLLESMGCTVVPLYCNGSGKFPHTPEPLPEYLSDLCESVKKEKADLGIAVDPDADRLVLIGSDGVPIGEEKTIALSIESVFSILRNSEYEFVAVVNHSTSMMTDFVADKNGGKVLRSPVGEINVVKKMKEVGAIIGGEGSGGVILPACHYGRDSLVGTALILTLISSSGKSLTELSDELPTYFMKKTKKQFSGDIKGFISKIRNEFVGEFIEDDGIKIINENYWIQLRASNTEPIIRIIAESTNAETCEKLLHKANSILDN